MAAISIEADKCHQCKTPKEVHQYYNDLASNYVKQITEDQYNGPHLLVEMLVKHVEDRNSRILEIAAGTGIVGQLLTDLGYHNLDAHDGAEKMLEVASSRGIYINIFYELFEPGKGSTKIPKAAYDVAIGVGIFSPGHLNTEHFDIFISSVKKGGKVIIAINQKWVNGAGPEYAWWPFNLEDGMKQREEKGVWKQIERTVVSNYNHGGPGVLYVYEVL